MQQNIYKKEKYQTLWILLSVFGVVVIFTCTAILCIMVLLLPPGAAPWDKVGSCNTTDGYVWEHPDRYPSPTDLLAWYPERFGLYDVNFVQTPDGGEASYSLNKEAAVAIAFLCIATVNSVLVTILIRPKIKSWFRLSTFNRVSIILELVCIALLIIGLLSKPQASVDQLNAQWQQGKDVDWSNLIFNHDPYMDTVWGSQQIEATGQMYSYTISGLATLIFTLIFILWCTLDTLFGFIITINRYRSWKRYQKIEEI